ncbi:MAG: twin-arginine translocation signal domain-containing protein [Gemmatimonadaceae bacterium]
MTVIDRRAFVKTLGAATAGVALGCAPHGMMGGAKSRKIDRLGLSAPSAHGPDFEFAKLEGKLPYGVLLERTDPALVAMEMDLFWITKGGQRPLEYVDRSPGRFELVHVKDMGPAPEQRMVDVGQGKIDWARIFARRDKAGIRHFFVEHDDPKPSPLASAKTSYEYLAQLRF